MNFTYYQIESRKFANYPDMGNNFVYPLIGLCGETGEIAEKIKKIIRDKDGKINEEDRKALSKELGDVLWYISQLATELGIDLNWIANENIYKLEKRLKENKIQGSGDDR